MAEIRTCEQYVLERLEMAERDVESLKMDIIFKDRRIEKLTADLEELVSFLQRVSRVKINEDGNKYIDFDAPWEVYDREDFKYMADILAMTTEDKEGN